MRSSKKSKRQSRVRKSLSPVTGKAGEKGGRSELLFGKQREIGLPFLTQMVTYYPKCYPGYLLLQKIFPLLSGLNKDAARTLREKWLLSFHEYILDTYSGYKPIRKRGSSCLSGKRSKIGKKTAGCSMSRSFGKRSKEAIESAKYL